MIIYDKFNDCYKGKNVNNDETIKSVCSSIVEELIEEKDYINLKDSIKNILESDKDRDVKASRIKRKINVNK